MTDNINIKDASGATITVASKGTGDSSNIQVPQHIISAPDGTALGTSDNPLPISIIGAGGEGNNSIGNVGLIDASYQSYTDDHPVPIKVQQNGGALNTVIFNGESGPVYEGNPFPIKSLPPALSSALFNRGLNTTTYSPGGVITDIGDNVYTTFENMSRTTGTYSQIVRSILTKNSTNVAADGFRLWLFIAPSETPVLSDGSVYLPDFTNKTNRLGFIDYVENVVGSDCIEYYSGATNLYYPTAISANLYGMLISKGTYTPASGETFYFTHTVKYAS